MMNLDRCAAFQCGLLVALMLLNGCGSTADTGGEAESVAVPNNNPVAPADSDSTAASGADNRRAPDFSPVVLGGQTPGTSGGTQTDGYTPTQVSNSPHLMCSGQSRPMGA